MRKFWIYRWKDSTGISGTGIVAEAVEFNGGQVVLCWTKSETMGVYKNIDQVREIHGHGGDTEVVELSDMFIRGTQNAVMDQMENAPFNAIGGPERRDAMCVPSWLTRMGSKAEDEFLRGYQHQARAMYGDDWKTCSFSWVPGVSLNTGVSQGGAA